MTRQSVLELGVGWFPEQLGGLNRYVHDLVAALDGPEDDVTAIVLGRARPDDPRVVLAAATESPLPVRLARYARAATQRIGPDTVVDVHFALYGAVPMMVARRRGATWVAHFHGPWAAESEAVGERAAAVAAKGWIERRVYRRAATVVVLSDAFKRLLVEGYGVRPWAVRVIRPGVDLDRFRPGDRGEARRELGLPADGFVVVTARRLVPRMGLDVLLRAWGDPRFSSTDSGLVIAGDGPERPRLELLAAELGVSGRVRWLGAVDDERLVRLYQAADAAAVPSLGLEGFGLVVLESLACGTPAVVSDVGGLPEALGPLARQLAVPPADPRLLADRLDDIRRGLGPRASACRARAEEHTWAAAAASHRAVYRGRVARRPRVVYLGHTARLSGAELSLLRVLPLVDVEPHVILGEDGPLVRELTLAGVSCEVLPLPSSVSSVRREDVRAAALAAATVSAGALYVGRLARRLRHLAPDLVQSNSMKALVYGTLAARAAGLPIGWHVHDRVSPDYLPASAVRVIKTMSRRLPLFVMANSDATAATLPGARNLTVVYPGILVPDRVEGRAAGPLRFGIVGRLAEWKGQHLFLEAFAQAFGDSSGDERAVVIGDALFDGDVAYGLRLRVLAEELGLMGRVDFRGFRSDIMGELAGLDVVVHASTLPEPFGQVVVEGMAAGRAVIAADQGGPSEIIEDGRSGLLYPLGDVAGLAEAMARLADPGLREALSAAGREAARTYSIERMAWALDEVYRWALRTGRPE